jgi:hypothetical protein
MNKDFQFILAMTCIIPAAVGIIRFKKMDTRFQPLVYILILVVCTEICERIAGSYFNTLAFPNLIANVFIVINVILHVWFFYSVRVIQKRQAIFYILVFILAFIGEGIYLGSFFSLYEIALILSYIIILLLCINGTVMQIYKQQYKWWEDGLFIFCAINIMFSAYVIFSFSLRFFGVPTNAPINKSIASMYHYINAGCYLLTLWALLCIPRKNYIELSF